MPTDEVSFDMLVNIQADVAARYDVAPETVGVWIEPVMTLEDENGRTLARPTILGHIGYAWTECGHVTLRIV
jgi:hypothetical protein